MVVTTISRAGCVAIVPVALGASPALAGRRYVALGDSLSSGTGTRTYFDAARQESGPADPSLVDAQRPNTALVLVACSGARTADVLSSQVASLTSDTRWVTITIGGTTRATPMNELPRVGPGSAARSRRAKLCAASIAVVAVLEPRRLTAR